MFSEAMPSNIRILELMRYLRFDLKTGSCRNLLYSKFALESQLWNSFPENF